MPQTVVYGPRVEHPIRLVLLGRRITVARHAEAIGYTQGHTEMVINGRRPATARFKERSCQALGLPESELFAEEP
jgi:hypothetical protein